MYQITVERVIGKKISKQTICKQIEYIVKRATAGSRKGWRCSYRLKEPIQQNSEWLFQSTIQFEKIRGQKRSEDKQWEAVKAMVIQTGKNTRFPTPWNVVEINENGKKVLQDNPEQYFKEPTEIIVEQRVPRETQKKQETTQGKSPDTWDKLIIPPELLGEHSDQYLGGHECWKNLYGVNPQIRILLSNIQRAQQTNGESRNHAVLFGHAGCGKTTTMLCLQKMFGHHNVLKLDATSTTKAGLEKLFFTEYHNKPIPPLVFMEEAEKADAEALKIWLGALDDRGEIHKINYRVNDLKAVKILFICSVNNKALFDRMMGSDGNQAGALSSRCVTQIYYPRPKEEILYQILEKEIRDHGGKQEWINPAIKLSKILNVNDPRIVRSFLAGGDRLLDETYQRDWQAIFEAQQDFHKK